MPVRVSVILSIAGRVLHTMTEYSAKRTSLSRPRLLAAVAALAVWAGMGTAAQAAGQTDADLPLCGAAGTWVDPATGGPVGHNEVLRGLTGRSAVLLGESHTSAEHHRWQLSVLASLHGQNPQLAVGFEAFPRRVQPILDEWSQGQLGVDEFLDKVEWSEVWGVDPDLYLPLLHFARMHRLPVVALNVERSLISRIGADGLDAVPSDAREGVGQPAPATPDYMRRLAEVYLGHQGAPGSAHQSDTETAGDEPDVEAVLEDPAFQRFVQAQQFWDRAMAEAMAEARSRPDVTQVVGIIGRGHMEGGDGVPRELEDLGVGDHAVLLPSLVTEDCAEKAPGLAQAVFMVDPVAERQGAPRLRLGVYIETADGGALVEQVVEDSVAEATGIAAGDLIVEAAGVSVGSAADLIDIIGRQSPGTWLPLTVEREGERLEMVAKLSPATPSP